MTTLVRRERAVRPPDRSGWRRGVHVLGELLVTLGVVILLFVAYELWWTGFYTQRAQHHVISQLRHSWAAPPPLDAQHHRTVASVASPSNGKGIAVLRIPRLGKDYVFAIVEGTGTDDLKKGPGHYSGTAMPGQLGDFAVAGHRTTYLHPFYDLNELKRGDPIVIETRTTWFTYRVSGTQIVDPHDIATVAPVPNHPGRTPHQRWLTFTTCNPRYSAAQRLVVHGKLAHRQPRSAGIPSSLHGVEKLRRL